MFPEVISFYRLCLPNGGTIYTLHREQASSIFLAHIRKEWNEADVLSLLWQGLRDRMNNVSAKEIEQKQLSETRRLLLAHLVAHPQESNLVDKSVGMSAWVEKVLSLVLSTPLRIPESKAVHDAVLSLLRELPPEECKYVHLQTDTGDPRVRVHDAGPPVLYSSLPHRLDSYLMPAGCREWRYTATYDRRGMVCYLDYPSSILHIRTPQLYAQMRLLIACDTIPDALFGEVRRSCLFLELRRNAIAIRDMYEAKLQERPAFFAAAQKGLDALLESYEEDLIDAFIFKEQMNTSEPSEQPKKLPSLTIR